MLLLECDFDSLVDKVLLENLSKSLCDKDIELLIVDDEEMKRLNLEQREIDKSTDVLSFPLVECDFAPLGSIVINIDRALVVSKNLGHSVEQEVALLFIHGLLHLLGYDHENDSGEMREKEEEIIKKFDLPQSLIVRTQI